MGEPLEIEVLVAVSSETSPSRQGILGLSTSGRLLLGQMRAENVSGLHAVLAACISQVDKGLDSDDSPVMEQYLRLGSCNTSHMRRLALQSGKTRVCFPGCAPFVAWAT